MQTLSYHGKRPTYIRYDAVDGRAHIAEAVLAGGQLAEVARRVGTGVVEEAEDDAAYGLVIDRQAELKRRRIKGGQRA